MSKLTLVRGDDWEGIYIDGKLVTEGHSHDTMEAIKLAIARGVTEAETMWANDAWLQDEGSLPRALHDVRVAK